MPLSAGDLVAGKYRIERPLGEGGMGRVYVATHGVLRKQVALKVMVERFRVSPDAVERFFREAVAASKVDHPAIAQVFDAGVHDDSPFMVMELLQGEDLDQRLERDGALSVDDTLRMARPILSALEAAHRAGVVHRDIKPPNIFLARRPDGVITPKLLDFGIAKHINDPNFDSLTQSGSVLGTPLYLAPEQARADSAVDHRADIYSIGVTLYHCLSGTTPHEATTFAELIGKMFSEPPRDLAELAPHVPPQLCSWIQRCLSRDPQFRPQSAQALLDGLNAVEQAAGHAHTPQAFAKTQLPTPEPAKSGTMEVVIAEPVPTIEPDPEPEPVETKTTAFEWGSQKSPAPEVAKVAPATPPTRHIPMNYAAPAGEAKRAVVPAATPAPPVRPPPEEGQPSGSAWSVAGMEHGLDPRAPAPKKSSGGIVFVLLTLFVVGAAVLGTWLFVAGGSAKVGAWMSALSGEESGEPPVTDTPTQVAVVDAGAPMLPAEDTVDSGAANDAVDAAALIEAMLAGDDDETITALMEAVRDQTSDPAPDLEDKGRLEVISDPPGTCFIDHRRIGETPISEMVPAGPHVVLVVADDGHRSTRQVTVTAGETSRVMIRSADSVPAAGAEPRGPGRGARRTVMSFLRGDRAWNRCRRLSGGRRAGTLAFDVDPNGRPIHVTPAPVTGGAPALRCFAEILLRSRLPGATRGWHYNLPFPR